MPCSKTWKGSGTISIVTDISRGHFVKFYRYMYMSTFYNFGLTDICDSQTKRRD